MNQQKTKIFKKNNKKASFGKQKYKQPFPEIIFLAFISGKTFFELNYNYDFWLILLKKKKKIKQRTNLITLNPNKMKYLNK